jgi:hypothetical protein
MPTPVIAIPTQKTIIRQQALARLQQLASNLAADRRELAQRPAAELQARADWERRTLRKEWSEVREQLAHGAALEPGPFRCYFSGRRMRIS